MSRGIATVCWTGGQVPNPGTEGISFLQGTRNTQGAQPVSYPAVKWERLCPAPSSRILEHDVHLPPPYVNFASQKSTGLAAVRSDGHGASPRRTPKEGNPDDVLSWRHAGIVRND
jgi:hypothetical protein